MDSSIGIIIAVAIAGFVVYKVFFNKDSDSASAPATSKPASKPTTPSNGGSSAVKATKAPSKAELNKLTKKAIDEKAAEVGIKLDARKTKAAMIKDFQSEVKTQLK